MNKETASLKSFPKISMSDAVDISHLMSYNISNSLWQVPYPYTVENAANFINSSHRDFESEKAANFAIQYKNNPDSVSPLVGTISLKNIDLRKRKQS